jgi:hypothetical protein
MAESTSDLQRLVRRDLGVFLAGSVVAVWLGGLLVAGRAGFVSRDTAATIMVGVGAVVCGGCLVWWALGPRRWLRDRYLVLVPVALAAPSVVVGLHDLGASFVAVVLSSAFGFGAAIALGLAWASRRS